MAFASCVLLLAGAAALKAERLPVRLYTTDDGLANNQINRIVRDSRGFLWFCTREGISRFDGYGFTNFGRDQGLPGGDQDLIETRSGDYWVATREGVARFSPTASKAEFTVYRPADPKAREMNALADDGAGGVWCGSAAGLYHLESTNRGWALRFVDVGMPTARFGDDFIEALLRDRNGNLWIGGARALYWLSAAGQHKRCVLRNNPGLDHILALLEDRLGRLWIGTVYGLLRTSIEADKSEPLIEKNFLQEDGSGLPCNQVASLLESSDGQLWAGTCGGVSRYIPGGASEKFENFTAANGLAHDEAGALGEDRGGNLWVAGIGAEKISRAGFVTYGQQDGLALNNVVSIFEDRSGELCVMTRDSRVNCFDGKRFHSVLPNFPNQMLLGFWGWHQITFQDHTGKWWVPTGEGLVRFPVSRFAQLASAHPDAIYNAQNGVPGEVFRIFEDSRGDVWISTWISSRPSAEGGLMRWEHATGIIHRYSAAEGAPSTTMAGAFAEDRGGNVWVSFKGLLARFSYGRFQFFEPLKVIGAFMVRRMYADDQGRLWVACSNGLVRIDSPDAKVPKFTAYTTAQGLATADVQCITEDRWGRIYVGTGRGVDSFYPRVPLHIRHYTKADGLALGNTMEAFRDRQGTLWFGTQLGLSRLDPEPDWPRVPPPVYISALRVRGVSRPISPLGETDLSGLKLGPDQNQIEIEFVGLGFGTGEALRYQYRLEGSDANWSQPTDERRIEFAKLSPGHYRFLVRAVTTDGLISAEPAAVGFTLAPPLYERWWLRTLVLGLLAAAIYGLHRYRVMRLVEMERLRTRIATDLHDDVGSTLSQIAILSEVVSRKVHEANELSEIAHLSRESVDSMSDIVWAIDPEQDHLGDLCHRMRRFASDLFASNGTSIQFSAPGDGESLELSPDMRRQIFLIFKESLHNAARHSSCSEINIDLRLHKGSLELTIHDNGSGFDTGTVQKGHGILSVAQRAKELGGCASIDSSPGLGTTIHLHVPVGHHFARLHKKT